MQPRSRLHLPYSTIGDQNPGLLFQFMFSEFLTSYRKTSQLHLHNRKLQETLKNPSPSSTSIEAPLFNLSIIFKDLSGSHEQKKFAWNKERGILTKLKDYYALFSQKYEGDKEKNQQLSHHIFKAWSCGYEGLTIAEFLEHQLYLRLLSSAKDYCSISLIIEKLYACLSTLSLSLSSLLMDFREDENVLLFLLRNQELLNQVYGSNFTLEIFCKIFPNGLSEAALFLKKQYSKRGFDQLLPLITSKINEMEKIS